MLEKNISDNKMEIGNSNKPILLNSVNQKSDLNIKEKLLKNYPIPVTIECTNIILKQMKECICKINNKKGKGTGFFCIYNNIRLLITNNHVIDEEIIKENNNIIVSIKDDKNEKLKIKLDDKKIYTSEKYDTTIIEIKEEEKINNFIDLDEEILQDNITKCKESIYIIQYPEYQFDKQKAHVSYGILKEIKDEYEINHLCSTNSGSSGSPILNISNNKVIGIHKESKFNYNIGTFLKYPINEYLNNINIIQKEIKNIELNKETNSLNDIVEDEDEDEHFIEKKNKKELIKKNMKNIKLKNEIKQKKLNEINIQLKIGTDDINEIIFFLNGMSFTNDINDNLKELNELNTELYINDIKFKFKKYFIPKNEGIYEIKLRFNINIKDCSFMFYNCYKIINLDLSSFDTQNITDMSYMFFGCNNITNINLSFIDTKNVINMSYMFKNCTNITYLDLSYFDTKNVKNMSHMFSFCTNITYLDLSSFDTKNVNNMSGMFYYCKRIINLDLSYFNTGNVIDMSYMFYGCHNIEDLNISSFDTETVTNMSYMFCGCRIIKNLNLSLFITEGVTNMSHMFCDCHKIINLDLSSFDTYNVKDMSFMFDGCRNITNINLSNFKTYKVRNISGMFNDCQKITNLDLSSFNTNYSDICYSGEYYDCIFTNCYNLKCVKIKCSYILKTVLNYYKNVEIIEI